MTTPTGPVARGALLVLFDLSAQAQAEHDDWHTHEHMPERLAVPGFLRGSRWVRATGSPRCAVVYEVAEPAVLDSAAYRARLDQPTPWTARIMPHYTGTRRTLCAVVFGEGAGLGGEGVIVTLVPAEGGWPALRHRLIDELLPGLAARRGIASCRLLENTLPAAMTAEQALRGRDGSVAGALWITGYDAAAVAALAGAELGAERLAQAGAAACEHVPLSLAYILGSRAVG